MANDTKIKVQRNGEFREFDLSAWNQFPENKYGWKPVADEPDEVKKLKVATGEETTDEEPVQTKPNAAELAKQIYEAETVEAVDALVPDGETRVTVTKAAEARKQQLAQPE